MQGNSAVQLVEKGGGKYSSFDKHRQFLPADHPFRRDIKNFTKSVIVTEPASQMLTGVMSMFTAKLLRDTLSSKVCR